jgi:DNA-binding Lrp family transcriptional regulator
MNTGPKFTKNERLVLKFLIQNGRMSDTAISEKLTITTQAVGKIRKKLEASNLIKGYVATIDYEKLGIKAFGLAWMKFLPKGWNELGELGIEKFLAEMPQVINAYRIPEGNSTHVALFGFKDVSEMDFFFSQLKTKHPHGQYIEMQKLFVFSTYSLIKNDPSHLIQNLLDEMGADKFKTKKLNFSEIERFKESLATNQ